MKTCIFLGPSANGDAPPADIDRFAPASLGSVYQAVEAGYRRIAIVDGVFGTVPSVWHKEVLYAMTRGVQVFGSSSMGALRAAELHIYGMVGVGTVFRLYRRGILTDDDEVALAHSPPQFKFSPLSLPMINIRATLNRMERYCQISRHERLIIQRVSKQLHFSKRSLDDILSIAIPDDFNRREKLNATFRKYYVDLKNKDYLTLLQKIRRHSGAAPDLPKWEDIVTTKWGPQFEAGLKDLPPLLQW